MKIKVNDNEKIVITNYLTNLIDLNKYDSFIKTNYPNIVGLNNNSTCLEIVNDYYIDQDKYQVFEQSIDGYIANNYKELLFVNDNKNCKYQVLLNKKDTSKDTFVKNGSLVIKIDRIISINMAKNIIQLDSLTKYLKNVEKEIESNIGIPVKVLFKDI